MTVRYRAWHKTWEELGKVKRIRFDDEGNVTTVLFEGKILGVDTHADEIELMQSTGLFDKHGKEIFEGDILEIQGIRMVVKFGNYEYIESSKSNGYTLGMVYDGLGFYIECINAADPDRISPFEPKTLKESAIIGNRFENPEFLEVEQ